MSTAAGEMDAVPSIVRRGWVGHLARRLHRRWLAALVLVLATTISFVWWRARPVPVRYTTAPVSRGAVMRSVSATGAVNPVVTVQVGAFVSGTIRSLECDYNTHVTANQRCAKIDPRPYQSVVDQNAAELASARAQLRKDQAAFRYDSINYGRDRVLLQQGVVSQDQVDTDRSTLDQARATVVLDLTTIAEHEAALRAAQLNLRYTDIVSPVEGTVISRNVDVGQTVAASFQTPTLFLIAKDLRRMQVDASVSESDIGGVAVGQRATFTVEAFPNRTFEGRVAQMRKAPISVQNVVTYDVVIAIDNADLALLPGMTANTRVITAEHDGVLRIPSQALRYSPGGVSRGAREGGPAGAGQEVWALRDGKTVAVPIVTGLDDGTYAEIVRGSLAANHRVILGEAATSDTGSGSAATPRRSQGPSLRF